METYRLSSRLREQNKEYLIQTANDANIGTVATTIYIDGSLAETVNHPHPADINPQEVLSLVKITHDEKKRELELLLHSYRRVLDAGNVEHMHQLGTAFFYKGFYHEARQLLTAALQIQPGHHQSMNLLCSVELSLGNARGAIAAAVNAVKQCPRYADYRNNLGEAYLYAEDLRLAINEFEEAISINLYYGDAYFNLGLARLALAKVSSDPQVMHELLKRTSDSFYKASLIYPGFKGQTFEEAMALLERGEAMRALSLFKSIREGKKENHRHEFSAFYMKSMLFPEWATEKVVGDRIRFLLAEISRNPSYVDLQTELAQAYLEQSRLTWQKGIDQYRKAGQLGPSLRVVQDALATSEDAYTQMCEALNRITGKA